MTPAEQMRENLIALVASHAANFRGDEVILFLEQVSNELWELGVDKAYSNPGYNEEMACAFDITWLTALLLKLRR